MVRVQVPATTANMGPGFDTLGMALRLYNTVEMSFSTDGLQIEVEGDGAENISRDTNNIVAVAAQKVFERLDVKPEGLKIKIINNIPLARGLGSSAAAIVGGLVAANAICENQLSEKELLYLATDMEGHPDNVAPALIGGIVTSLVDGGEVHYVKIDPPSELRCVVAIPDFELSTRRAREVLPQSVSMADAVFNVSRTAFLVAAFMRQNLNEIAVAMDDKLHQPYRANLVPGMKKVLAAARLAGAKGVALSGAGPTLIAFCDQNSEIVANVMKKTFLEAGINAKVMELEPNPVGALALELKK